jgi:hypothetical protein
MVAADSLSFLRLRQENSDGTYRTNFNALISDKDFVEYYTPNFRRYSFTTSVTGGLAPRAAVVAPLTMQLPSARRRSVCYVLLQCSKRCGVRSRGLGRQENHCQCKRRSARAGIPSCTDGAFQNDVMRGQWGWDGFIVSDCGAVQARCLLYAIYHPHLG